MVDNDTLCHWSLFDLVGYGYGFMPGNMMDICCQVFALGRTIVMEQHRVGVSSQAVTLPLMPFTDSTMKSRRLQTLRCSKQNVEQTV